MTLSLKTIGLCILLGAIHYQQAAATTYYRSSANGFWKNPSIWETADDATFTVNVLTATTAPDYTAALISIKHTVTIDQSTTIDETIVEMGGTLIYGNYSTAVLSIQDGPGIDLQIDGTFEDSGPFNISWNTPSASWAMSSSATMIRTRSTSATLWRDHYESGMTTIPATSNWIIRKQGADNPSISAIASYYGNLKVENTTTAFWNATVVGSKFIGISSAPVIKGTMEVGKTSGYGVKFYSQNSATTPWLINGNLLINQGSELNLEDASSTTGASGINLQGNLIVNGILSYDVSNASDNNRVLKFSGGANQHISGIGILLVYNLVNNKISGNLILDRSVAVDNKVSLENGQLDLNKNCLSLQNNSTTAIGRTNGWLKSETTDNASKVAWNIGNTIGVYEFPFGKNDTHYIPFALTLSAGDIGIVTVTTYATTPDNMPYPTTPNLVTNLDINNLDNSPYTVDRFWQLDKTGTSGTATLSFSYSSDEAPSPSSLMVAQRYASSSNVWEVPLCCQTQNLFSHNVTVPNVVEFSVWTLMEINDALSLKEFNPASLPSEEKIILEVAPIPFSEYVFVTYYSEADTVLTIELFNSLGVLLLSEKIISTKGTNTFQLPLSSISEKGVLYIRFIGEKKVKIVKVLRE